MSKNIEYEFECVNGDTYAMAIQLQIHARTYEKKFNFVFRILNTKQKEMAKKVESFEIDKNYLNYLKTLMSSTIKKIAEEIKSDNIMIITTTAKKADMKKQGEWWILRLHLTGEYVDV